MSFVTGWHHNRAPHASWEAANLWRCQSLSILKKWICSLHVLCFFHFSSLRFHWPPSPHTHALSCVKSRGRCAIIGLLVRCLAIAQLMDRHRERCVQDLLPEFTGNVAPFFQLVMIPSNGFIDVDSQVPSHTESYGMPCCHGACHSFDDSRKKNKNQAVRSSRYLASSALQLYSRAMSQDTQSLHDFKLTKPNESEKIDDISKIRHEELIFCMTHELERLPNVCCSTRGCSHRFALHTCYSIFWWEAQQINNFGFETTV